MASSTYLRPSALIERFGRTIKGRDSISVGEISDQLGSTGFGFLTILLSAPALIPIPGPFGLVFGTALALVSCQVICGAKRFWLPAWLHQRRFTAQTVTIISSHMIKWLKPVERFVYPRRMRFMTLPAFSPLCGIPVFLLSIAIALPLPLGNLLPCIALIILAIGLMARDGLATLIGLAIGVVALLWSATLIYFGERILGEVAILFGIV
jgi:hypothetical protein